MKARIPGFDLARGYAIFGMFVVNFNTVFGSHTDKTGLSGFLNLFNGNSSTLFVMLAGMGISLMSNRGHYSLEEKNRLRQLVFRRSWFLFFFGLAFYLWWPADILHFYGGYLHFAGLLLFVPKRYYLLAALGAVLVFHGLLALIPYQTGWDFASFSYPDFWTVEGFLRNTFYNGWNSIFPWLAFFLMGMYLGRLNWSDSRTTRTVFGAGLLTYLLVTSLQYFANSLTTDEDILTYLQADYLPPFLPFMLGTASFGCMLLSGFVWLGNKIENSLFANILASTGQMTLTHYVVHLVLGLYLLSVLAGKNLSYDLLQEAPSDPKLVLGFALGYFMLSCAFSYIWLKKHRNGPFEALMRMVSDRK